MSRTESLMELEQQVGVMLRRIRRVIAERAGSVHESLQPASYLMLTHVAAHGPVRASSMAGEFDIDKGAISRQVQHLIELGLLQGSADPCDRRATLLTITPEARRRLDDVASQRRAWLDQRLGDWATEDLEGFVEGLARYNATLNE